MTSSSLHPELPVEVLEAWQALVASEQRHLDELQHALYRQPNYTRMGEDAATEEDPSRREERQTESW